MGVACGDDFVVIGASHLAGFAGKSRAQRQAPTAPIIKKMPRSVQIKSSQLLAPAPMWHYTGNRILAR